MLLLGAHGLLGLEFQIVLANKDTFPLVAQLRNGEPLPDGVLAVHNTSTPLAGPPRPTSVTETVHLIGRPTSTDPLPQDGKGLN
jgi:hypothetical protein